MRASAPVASTQVAPTLVAPVAPAPVAWLSPLVLFALLAAAPAQAGSPEDPEVTDPLGDAGPVPSPAGFEWADITAAWFEDAGDGAGGVRLAIQVAALDGDPPGEVGAHFRVGGRWWLAGWTTVLFPAPPFTYAGGFHCQAEADGSVPDASTCGSLDATHGDGRFVVVLPAATFGLAPGIAIEEPRGYAVDVVSAQPEAQAGWVEVTAPGRPFVVPGAGPAAAAAPAGGSPAPPGGGASPGIADEPGAAGAAGAGGTDASRARGSPAAGPWAACATLAAAALAARRRFR